MGNNEKPVVQGQVEALDYSACSDYIANKLGIKDIRDVAGRWGGNENAPYQDWWHIVIDQTDLSNESVISIGKDYWSTDKLPEWAVPIFEAFVSEFGEDADYWVSW